MLQGNVWDPNKAIGRYRGVVDLWRVSATEILLEMYGYIWLYFSGTFPIVTKIMIYMSIIYCYVCGILCGGVVRVSDIFPTSDPNLKDGGSIPHAITSANLDFHYCV